MVFIGAPFGGLSKVIGKFGKRELDAQTIQSQLASFPFNNHPIATSQEEFAKTTLAYLLANPKANFQAEISGFIDKALPNFINTQQAGNKTYGSQTEVFNVFKDEFNTLINDMLGTIFQGSDKNPNAQAQKSAFESNFDQFWQTSGRNQQSKHASCLESLVAVKVNLVTVMTSPTNSPSIINPAAMGVITQVASSTTAPTPVPKFDPLNISDVLTLATDDLSNTLSKVKIPHAQLKEYAIAYGDLIQGKLSENVLKLAINSVNPGIRLDVASEAMPEIEKFITKCLEADGIRLAEGKAQSIDPAEIKTLVNSPKAQENLNEILKKLGLEYDFKTLTLRQNAFIDQVPDYVGKIAQLDISGLTAEQGSSTLKVNNQEHLIEIYESVVDKKDTTIKHLSFINYPEAPASLINNIYFKELITDSNRSDLIIELPYSQEAVQSTKELKAKELAQDPEKLMPEIRFIHASLEDSDIPALRGLIKQAAAKAEPNAEISSKLKSTLEAYANKTSAERSRAKELLTSATKEGGYGLDAVKDKPYIDYILNAIAPESVKGFNDVYDLQGYQSNLAEAFKASLINNPDQMWTVRNPIQAIIKQAREIEVNFKPVDNLPKISDVLEKALFAAKPDTESKSYSLLNYFYWVERGLSHPELLKELTLENNSLKDSTLNMQQAGKLLKGYFEIATASNDLEKSKKLSGLIAEGFNAKLLVEKFKLIDTAMGRKYSDYLSQNSSYNQESRPPLSGLDIFTELLKPSSQQVSNFIEKEINSLKSVNPSPLAQVSDESIDLYKQLFISSAKSFTTREFLFKSLIESPSSITDELIKASTGRVDKLIEDFQALDSVLIPSFKEKLPHLEAWAKPLLEEGSTNWQGTKVSVCDSLNSYKDLDLQGLLNHGKQILQTLFMSDSYKPDPLNRLFKTKAERGEVLNYINKFNTTAKPADIYSQEFKDRAKAAFLNLENKTPEAFAQSIDRAHARVNSMQNDSLDISLNHLLGNNLYTLIKPFVNVRSEDQGALEQLKTSLKTNNSAANLLNVINLNKDDLIQLGVKPEQASVENLARYMRYQESPNNDALKLDMQAHYKSLTEGDKPASHPQAITQIHQEFKEFLQAYDNSQLASRLEAIGKKLKSAVSDNEPSKLPDFTKLSESQAMRDFSLELGTVNPTNILNRTRIYNFIDSHSHKLDDGSVMLGLPKESPEQEREYIHLNAKEYKDFSEVMVSYFAENIKLSETNIRRDDLIIHPFASKLLDNTGGLLNTGSTENASRLLLLTNPGLRFGGMNFVEEGGLLLPKGLTEVGSPLVTTQEPGTLVSKDTINLTQNAFKIYTLASEAKAPTLKNFTPSSNIAHNLNLGDYAREALLELNAKQSQEKEEKTLIADTFRSLLSANSQDIPARFAAYEAKNGTLPELYKDLGWNNVFLQSLKINQGDYLQATHKAAEYLTRGIDQALSEKAPAQKTQLIEGIEKMFEVFEAVYLKIFSNAETSSGATLGEGKIKPLMENKEVQAYFEKNRSAGMTRI